MNKPDERIRAASIEALSSSMTGQRTAPPGVEQALSACGFLAPAAAAANLTSLAARALAARVDPVRAEEDVSSLLAACTTAASPDDALRNLDRFLERSGGVAAFLSAIAAAPPLRTTLATLFGASQYMSDILVRSPGLAYWLAEQRTWDAPLTVDAFEEEFIRESSLFGTLESQLDAIRRAHRRNLLAIGVRDLVGRAPVETVTGWLSSLAIATVRVVLARVTSNVDAHPKRDARSLDHSLAVIAMGKLGGLELNYSSDIDLIFVCGESNDADIERLTRIARGVTDALSASSYEGYLYRVDLRLRPDGVAGPLVTTASAARIYYENRARPWEFQAMLKARVVAGHAGAGGSLLSSISRLIYTDSLSYSPVDAIAASRARIRENIPPDQRGFNIKLMEGGIRDVEFIAQTVQLTHGASNPQVRCSGTLEALAAISKNGYLQEWEVDNLAQAYRFFRLVEHRLQMMHQIKTHTVPAADDEIALLSRRCACGPLPFVPDDFLALLSRHLGNVRAIAEGFFSGHPVHPHTALLMLAPEDERAPRILGQYGLRDTRRAIGTLNTMAHGSFPRLLDRKTRRAFERALPDILEGVSPAGDPDSALVNLSRLAASGKNESAFYALIADVERARRFALFVSGLSSVLTSALCKQAHLFESLANTDSSVGFETQFRKLPPDAGFVPRGQGQPEAAVRQRQEKQREWFDRARLHDFAVGLQDGFRPTRRGASRSLVAARHIAAAFDAAFEETDGVALFALGSYATEETQPESDIDLLVVTDGADVNAVTDRLHDIVRWFDEGRVLKLDFRLRGEGQNAPLVQSIDTYRSYFADRLSPWERVAFTRCRPWWGDPRVQRDFSSLVREYVERPVSGQSVVELSRVRKQLELLAPARYRVWETKRAAGGRYDVEYISCLGIGACPQDGGSLGMGLRERLNYLAQTGFISRDERTVCVAALDLYAHIEYFLQLQGFSLPRSAERHAFTRTYLDRTFAWIGHPVAGGVEKALARSKSLVRAVYDAVLARSAG